MSLVPLTKTQRLIRRRFTRLRPVGNLRDRKFRPELTVGNQHFSFGYDHPAPKKDCEWMRDMMAKALSALPGLVEKVREVKS